jgi:ATP-dependent exoDNAse (exonuclease V) beta subunit
MEGNLSLFAMPEIDRDAVQRERALDTDASFIVQAPAGSGKTELLVQRFLALLAVVKEPENIVAITFTRKAAGEMRTRVTQALREAASTAPPEEAHKRQRWKLAHSVLGCDEKRGWKLLESPGRLRIVTIDSLCHSITRMMPLTSQLGATRNVSEKPGDLYAIAAHRTIQLLGTSDPIAQDVRRALEHLDNNVGMLEAELVKMLGPRDQWLRHVDLGNSVKLRAKMEATLRRIVSDRLEAVQRMIPDELRQELVRLARLAANHKKMENPEHAIASCEDLDGFPDCTPEALKNWCGLADLVVTQKGEGRKTINIRQGFPRHEKDAKEDMGALIEELERIPRLLEELDAVRGLPPACYSETQWQALESFARILPLAAEQLKTVFLEQQTCDYAAISEAALHALGKYGRPSELALALGEGIEHLLVDEFQDTSVSQVKLLEALTGGWKHGDGRTLFLVGDPMQSIYRFREAEVASFIRISETKSFGPISLELLQLEKNFRSRQVVVDWVNEVFPTVFPQEEDLGAGAVKFSSCLAAGRNKEGAAKVQLHTQFGTNDETREEEAAQVVQVLRELRARGEKAAVLVRSRTHLYSIVSLLREEAASEPELRFQAVEIDALGKQVVISDLRALTHALLHLGDRVAWLAILRAPWCGLSLRDLHALVSGAKNNTVLELIRERRERLGEDGQSRLIRVLPVLERALFQRGRLPLRQWVESTWLSLNGPACLREDREMEDAAAFFDLLDELDFGSDVESLAGLDTAVTKLFSQPDPDATDAIQVMTIHKAKGLEFDAVLLPGLGRATRGSGRSLLLWSEREIEGSPELLMAATKAKGGEEDPIYRFLKKMEDECEDNELRRLLYVAATRAKHELHLFASLGCDAQEFLAGGKAPQNRSMLALLWPAIESDFRAQAELRSREPIRIAAAAAVDAPLPLRRLPLNWKAPEIPTGIQWQGGREPEAIDPEDEVTYDWAGERARRVGVVVHTILQKVGEDGLTNWSEERVRTLRPVLEAALANEGVAPDDMQEALARAETALVSAITGERGRWILQGHAAAKNELSLTGFFGSALSSFVIDRTFVCNGVRWIIDYKTGLREGSDREAFLDNEVERYREKMERYAEIFGRVDASLPIRVGLYYPLMNGWREWEPSAALQRATSAQAGKA